MSVAVGQYVVNTEHINQLARQIAATDDCEILDFILEEHLGSIQNLFNDTVSEQATLLRNILPILSIPGANPAAIVKWIQKLVTGIATPQLNAYIKYTKNIIELSLAITRLAAAVEQSQRLNGNCNVVERTLGLDQIKGQLDGAVNNALLEVNVAQNAILDIVDIEQTVGRIDTSSPQRFLETVDRSFDVISARVDQLQNQPIEDN